MNAWLPISARREVTVVARFVASGPLRLRPLAVGDEREARQAHRELAVDGFDFLLDERPGEPWVPYVERLEQTRRGRGLGPDRVPATFLVAEVDGQISGGSPSVTSSTPTSHRSGATSATGCGPTHAGAGTPRRSCARP